jgi:hypothetical protein
VAASVGRAGVAVDLEALSRAFERTVVREHMSVADATDAQFQLVDFMRRTPIPNSITDRPVQTAWAEAVLARFFAAEDAVLVQGAGTGAVRAMLNASVRPGARVLVHAAPVYRTTEASMRHMGIRPVPYDFNDLTGLAPVIRDIDAVHLQHAPQRLGDQYELSDVVAAVRASSKSVPILVDENCVVMRARRTGTQLGASASAFSLLKLLAGANIGCVLGSPELVRSIRSDLSSQGSEVRGEDAADALNLLVYAPVTFAIQNEVVKMTATRLNELAAAGELPDLFRAIACQPIVRSVVLVLRRPVARDLLAWLHAAIPREVWAAEESRYWAGPTFTLGASTFLRDSPELADYTVRINPVRSGPETIIAAVRSAMGHKDDS